MISVIIATLNDERRLGGTLAALVPAAVDGLVRQLIIADGGSTDATLEVADDAGAVMVEGGLNAACHFASQPWLMLLDAGARLEPGWEPLVHAHIQASPQRAGLIEAPTTGGRLSRLWRRAPLVGVVAPEAMLAEVGTSLTDALKDVGRGLSVRLTVRAVLEP